MITGSIVQVNVTQADLPTPVEPEHVHVAVLLLPSVTIAVVMLTFLSISFIRHHRLYVSKRQSHLEHLKAGATGKRQRIGAPTCFANPLHSSGVVQSNRPSSDFKSYFSQISSVNEIKDDKGTESSQFTGVEHTQKGLSKFPQIKSFHQCVSSIPSTTLNQTSLKEDRSCMHFPETECIPENQSKTSTTKNLQNVNLPADDKNISTLSKELSKIAFADDMSSPEFVPKDFHVSVSENQKEIDKNTGSLNLICTNDSYDTVLYPNTSSENKFNPKSCDEPDSMKGQIINKKSEQPNIFGDFEVHKTPDTQHTENVAEATGGTNLKQSEKVEFENKFCTCEPSYAKFNRHNRRFSYLEMLLQGKRMDLFRLKKISDTGENIPLRESDRDIDLFLQCRWQSNPSITTKCLVCNNNIV